MGRFGVISSFNALHHAFSRPEAVQQVLASIDSHLDAGGFFVGIFPDGGSIRRVLGTGCCDSGYADALTGFTGHLQESPESVQGVLEHGRGLRFAALVI